MLAPGRTTILLQLLLLAIGPAFSPAPARAAGEPHYIVHVILEPASREVQVRMSVRLPIGAEQRFSLDRGFAVKTIEIDGQTVDPAGQTWPLPTGRPVEIVYAAVLPALARISHQRHDRRVLFCGGPLTVAQALS